VYGGKIHAFANLFSELKTYTTDNSCRLVKVARVAGHALAV
jgi:hypothetical protein